jgi:hypothetical protein
MRAGPDNAPSAATIALFYRFPLLCDVIRHFVGLAILDELLKENNHGSQHENEQIHSCNESWRHNLLPPAHESRHFNLDADGARRSDLFCMARGLRLPSRTSLHPSCQRSSPRFSMTPHCESAVGLSNDNLVSLIDEYFGGGAIQHEEDYEVFAGMVFWTSHRPWSGTDAIGRPPSLIAADRGRHG